MAYGTNAAWGLKPVRYKNGSPYTGAVNSYGITSAYSTSLFTGDPVTFLNTGMIGIGVAGAACLGVFMGCKYTQSDGTFKFNPMWPASTTVQTGTTIQALIADDPNLVFSMQEAATATTAGTPLALADQGLNANFAAATGNSANGLSAYFLDNTTEATTISLNMKIIALDPAVGNAVGNYANWLVTWNNHIFQSTGTSGI